MSLPSLRLQRYIDANQVKRIFPKDALAIIKNLKNTLDSNQVNIYFETATHLLALPDFNEEQSKVRECLKMLLNQEINIDRLYSIIHILKTHYCDTQLATTLASRVNNVKSINDVIGLSKSRTDIIDSYFDRLGKTFKILDKLKHSIYLKIDYLQSYMTDYPHFVQRIIQENSWHSDDVYHNLWVAIYKPIKLSLVVMSQSLHFQNLDRLEAEYVQSFQQYTQNNELLQTTEKHIQKLSSELVKNEMVVKSDFLHIIIFDALYFAFTSLENAINDYVIHFYKRLESSS